MGKPSQHAATSVRIFGGKEADYLLIHERLDSSKQLHGSLLHRVFTHQSSFIATVIDKLFGSTLRNSDGVIVSVREIAEQHVFEDFRWRFLPSAQDYLMCIPLEFWLDAITEAKLSPVGYAKLAAKRFGGGFKAYLAISELMESVRAAMPDARSKIPTHNSWFVEYVVVPIFGEEITVPVTRRGKKISLKVAVREVANYHIQCTFGDKPILSAGEILAVMQPQPWMDNARDNSLPPSHESLRSIIYSDDSPQVLPGLIPNPGGEMVVDGPHQGLDRPMIIDGGPISGGGGMRMDGGPRTFGSMRDDVVGASGGPSPKNDFAFSGGLFGDKVGSYEGPCIGSGIKLTSTPQVEDQGQDDSNQTRYATRMTGSVALLD